MDEAKTLHRLNALLRQYRLPGLPLVRSCDVVPDWTNRERTGLSLEHVHFVAASIRERGFTPRSADGARGHDLPVLVREGAPAVSALGEAALVRWRAAAASTPGMPPCEARADCFYTSLGSGHFSQALNLFRQGGRAVSIFDGAPLQVGEDRALAEALRDGVPSLVLRNDMPERERKFVSLALNTLHGVRWATSPSGDVSLTLQAGSGGGGSGGAGGARVTQFEAMSKILDAEELSSLIRTKLGIDLDDAQGGYKATLGKSKL